MRLFAGLDAGQSGTQAVLADERGRILGRGAAGPADELGEGPDSTKLHDALAAALAEAIRAAGLPAGSHCELVVAGISGWHDAPVGHTPELPAERALLLHDALIAHAGAFGDGPGVLAIAGTGSVVYARNAHGKSLRVGGWGHLFGDEGGAFGIGREAILEALSCIDGGLEPSPVARAARRQFGLRPMEHIVLDITAGRIGRHEVAAIAPAVIKLAGRGELDAQAICDDAIEHLVADAVMATYRLEGGQLPTCVVGGLMNHKWYRLRVMARVQEHEKSLAWTPPQRDPAAGALLLAYREAGLDAEPDAAR